MDTKFLDEFSKNTAIKKYLVGISQMLENNQQGIYTEKYLPIIKQNKPKFQPFLSVIIRTQGKREDGLREALLCMAAQSCQDFEIILIGHKLNQEQSRLIDVILEDQDSEFKSKIRYFKLDEGGRTAPLNFGFANAWGQYAAIFDDDDILFDNWVESFKKCAEGNFGRILHSFAFSQQWKIADNLGYRAESAPLANYCTKFDLVSQLTINRCPLMTLAFPVNIFQKLGIIFNEDLNVTEDWEYLMRLSFLCGVSDIGTPTAIYRFWENLETSATLHKQEDWNATYKSIQEGFDKSSIILPSGNIQKIISLIERTNSNSVFDRDDSFISRFYFSKGASFNDMNCIKAVSEKKYPEFDAWFLFEEKTNELTAMRFDLCEEGLFILDSIEITVWFTNGEKYIVPFEECIHNGIKYENRILFLHEDPEIVWEWNDGRMVDVVHICGAVSKSLDRNGVLNRLEALVTLKDRKRKKMLSQKGYF